MFSVYVKIQQNSRIVCGQHSECGSDANIIMVTPTEDIPVGEETFTRERLCTPPRPSSADKRIQILEVINENGSGQPSPHLLRPPIYAVQFCHKSMHQTFGRYLPEVE